jgi:hypothetical protein
MPSSYACFIGLVVIRIYYQKYYVHDAVMGVSITENSSNVN